MSKFKTLGNAFNRIFRNDLNDNFNKVDTELNSQKKRVDDLIIGNPQPSEVVDARLGFPLLREKLEDTDSRLAQKEHENFKNSLVNHKTRKPRFLWFDDDGHKGVYTKIAPLLRKYGVRLHVAVITDRPHGFPIAGLPPYDPESKMMSYDEMKELENEGLVRYVPHTHTHDTNNRLTDMSELEMRHELETNQKIMKQLGWNFRDLVYPFGAENEFVHSIVRQYFRSAFDVGGGALTTPLNQYKIPRIKCDAPETFADIKSQIDDVFTYGTLGALTTHVDQYGGLDISKMEQVVQYIIANGGEFVWVEEAISDFGNLLQVGNDSIGFDGEIYGNRLAVYRNGHLDFEPNAPITDFRRGTTTRLKLTRAITEQYNIPQDAGYDRNFGFIEVYRDSTEDTFSFQKLTDVHNRVILHRSWNVNENNWGVWSEWKGKPLVDNSYKRSYSNLVIPPNSSIDRATSYGSAQPEAFYIIKPSTTLPLGVTVDAYCWVQGQLIIRVTNSRAQEITLESVEFDIKKLML